MRCYQLGASIGGLIFDMDNTLYTHPAYARHQEDVLVERLAREKAWEPEAAHKAVEEQRQALIAANQGRKPSLGTVFLHLGIPIAQSVAWREACIRPEDYLEPDPALAAVLERLAGDYRLAVVTNNPVATARRSLERLGVGRWLPLVIGLDTTGVSKPDPQAFALAGEGLGLPSARIVSVGDRYDIDIAPALALGMGGILVDGVEDVYRLPEALGGKS